MAPLLIQCPTCGLSLSETEVTCPRDGTLLGDEARAAAGPWVEKGGPLPWDEEGTEQTMVRPRDPLEGAPSPGPGVAAPGGAWLSGAPEALPATSGNKASEVTAQTDPLIGLQLGEYVVKTRIGVGGMGLVYGGEQPVIGKQVAIKILRSDFADRPGFMERLLAEARAVNAIRHRGIIDIFSFGRMQDGRQYFVMEFLDGVSLDVHIAQQGRLTPRETLELSQEILAAIAAAHQAGVIHRDLKPHNIFVVKQPGGGSYVKVLDFGLAKLGANPEGATSQTQNGFIIGTPEYMAPEQIRCEPVSPRTDLYSFGVVAFQMLTGQLPFMAIAPAEYLVRHLSTPPRSPLELQPELPPALAELVLRLLAKRPEERPGMEEVRAELKRIARLLPQEDNGLQPASELAAPPEVRAAPSPLLARDSLAIPETGATRLSPARRRAVGLAVSGGVLAIVGAVAILRLAPERPGGSRNAPETASPAAASAGAPPAAPAVTRSTAAPPGATAAPDTSRPPSSPPPVGSVAGIAPNVATPPTPGGRIKRKSERQQLLERIAHGERALRAKYPSGHEPEGALSVLRKARARAESANTPSERQEVTQALDIWERSYLRDR